MPIAGLSYSCGFPESPNRLPVKGQLQIGLTILANADSKSRSAEAYACGRLAAETPERPHAH